MPIRDLRVIIGAMASKGDIEKPISLVKPAHAKSVQAILDRAHRQEASANKALARTVDKALHPPRGKGLLSKTLGMALSHHGRTKKGGPSLRPVAPDTKGRAFHFSHSTVGRTSGAGGGRGGSTTTNRPSTENGRSSGGAGSPGATTTAGPSPATGPQDLGSKEAGHQRYVERDAALARDAAEEFGIEVGPHRQPSPAQVREAGEGMEPGQGIHREKVQGKEADQQEAEPTEERARPIEMDVAAMQKEIAKAVRGRRTQSAEAAQAYIEDPTKVAPQVRHGHSNSFGTIGETFEERVAFWNAVQKHEREKDARTQVRLVLELPHEATPAARQEIVKRFCEEYERLGVPYWASIHAPTKKNDDRNHHAHIVHGLRPARMMVDPATGEKAWDFTITETYKKKNRVKKTTHPHRQNVVKEFRNRDYVRDTRKRFAETANQVLEKAGCPIRYDARSYKDMGLDIEPMKHVARILTDKSKIHDFVVMDPEWTRRMIEQEMNAAAVERDKTYMDLKRVEKRLAEVSNSITRLRDANAKLPKRMKLSPLSRMTVTTAKVITRRMLEVEQARIAQRFADEATERTIQHVIDATSTASGHRNGQQRRAKPMPGSQAPDERAMAFLHKAAVEEMRLHRISTSGRMRTLGLRAAAAYHEWRSEADPPLRAEATPSEPTRQRAASEAPHPPTAESERRAPQQQESSQQPPAAPTVAPASPTMTPTETVLAMAPTASERIRQGIMSTMARMQASTDALLQATNGPGELAEVVKAMIANVATRHQGDATATQPTVAPIEATEPNEVSPANTRTAEGTGAPPKDRVGEAPTLPTGRDEPIGQPGMRDEARDGVGTPGSSTATPDTPRPRAETGATTATTVRPAIPQAPNRVGFRRRDTAKDVEGTARTREPDLFGQPGARQGTSAPPATSMDGRDRTRTEARETWEPRAEPPGVTGATTAQAETTRAPARRSDGRSTESDGPATATTGDAGGRTGETASTRPPPTTPQGRIPERVLGPDDFLPKRQAPRKLERTPGVPPPQLRLNLTPTPKDGGEPGGEQRPERTEPIPTGTAKEQAAPQRKKRVRRKVIVVRDTGPTFD